MTTPGTEQELPPIGTPPKDDPMRPQGPTHHESEPVSVDEGAKTNGPTHHEQPQP
ncbi:hypothetical protein JOF56_002942 [Kibdelosporangium banguiense]|uniref:Sigma-like protein n=1 Tax=Kibdelosporangium banguiense TaxID=1365924 RepID=A0ABS4TDQ1_9PSEU|nr:hypothetical protein [Kibdelosporangium banguiense]MBP2322557.1 hypothetical protein [Kibdelosporangium banguiense]